MYNKARDTVLYARKQAQHLSLVEVHFCMVTIPVKFSELQAQYSLEMGIQEVLIYGSSSAVIQNFGSVALNKAEQHQPTPLWKARHLQSVNG